MRKQSLLLSLLLLCPLLLSAGPVSREQARKSALSFIQQRESSGARKAPASPDSRRLTEVVADPAFYVFNVGAGSGFVMVSASDRTQPILGYSDNGAFSLNGAPDPLKEWLTRLSSVITAVEEDRAMPASAPHRAASSGKTITKNFIPTLVPSRWNQGNPYNLQCPTYDNNGEPTLSATGCVATAMAQIMYFWRWPQEPTTEIPGYTSGWNNTTVNYPALPSVTFDWDSMTDTYDASSSEESKQAVAELMHYVGRSVQMGYGPSSGAASVNTVNALKNYYGYDKNMYYTSHDRYTYQAWEDLIYSELAAGRPVLMNGDTSERTGGHEWVCDGYDGNGCFHMNWGWGGMCDGYFLLTVMFPDQQGIGGSTSSDGYSMGQGIVVGLQPGEPGQQEPEETVRISLSNLRVPQTEYTRNSANGYFRFTVQYGAGTNLSNSYNFDTAFTLYDEQGNIVKEEIGTERNFNIKPGTWWPTRSCGVTFGPGLADGTYFIKGRSRLAGTTEWNEDDNFNKAYIKAVISGTTNLSLTVYPAVDLTVNSLDLIGSGGAGTELKVKANITNNDTEEYYRDTYLLVDGQWVSGNCIVIPGSSTDDYYFKYTPTTAGEHEFALSTSKETADVFYTVTKRVDEAYVPELSIVMSSLSERDGDRIYGNCMRLQVKVTNNGDRPYQSYIEASPWEVEGGYYWKRSSSRQDIDLAPGRDTTLVYEFTDLNYGSRYNFHADSNGGASANLGDFTFNEGILYWTPDGVMHGVANRAGFVIDESMTAVSFPGQTPVSFSLSDKVNTNTVLYFADGATVNARVLSILKNRGLNNVVIGPAAENIVIADGLDFLAPKAFTAATVSYTADVPATAADAPWSTLALPFTPQTVEADGQPVEWFTSATDKGKSLVVKEFSAAEGSVMYFGYAQEILANRPYIVSFAGNEGGTGYDLSGKKLVFAATDAVIEPVERMSTYSTDYSFAGTTTAASADGAYVLSPDGTSFRRVEGSYQTSPFRAVMIANSDEAAAVSVLTVGGNVSTSISAVESEALDGQPVYNLSGVRVGTYDASSGLGTLPRGVYIVGGKKLVR